MLHKSQQSRGNVHLPFCYHTIHAKILQVSLSTRHPPLLEDEKKIARFIKVPRRRFILYVERWFRDRGGGASQTAPHCLGRSPHAGHC